MSFTLLYFHDGSSELFSEVFNLQVSLGPNIQETFL